MATRGVYNTLKCGVYNKLKEQEQFGGQIILMPEETNWLELKYEKQI